MNPMTLSSILPKEEQEYGLYLEELPDHYSLMRRGSASQLCWFGKHALIKTIQHEAHQALCWGKAGILFEKLPGRQCEYSVLPYLCAASDCERNGRKCGLKEEALRKEVRNDRD